MLDIIIWLVLLCTLSIGVTLASIYFLVLSYKRETIESVKKYYRLVGIFLLALGLCGFLDFTYAYLKKYLGIMEDPLPPVSASHGTYFFIITTCLMFSFWALTRTIEKYIKQSEKMPLSKIMLICVIITLIPYVTPNDITDLLVPLIFGTMIPFGLIILYWGVFYLKLAAKSEGVLKKRAYFVGFGLGTIFVGILLDILLRDFAVLTESTGYLFPLVCVAVANIGVPLLFLGFKRD